MIILLLFIVLLALFAWVLIAPLQLQIDTKSGLYQVQWKSIGHGRLVISPTALAIRLKVLFWQKEWPLQRLVGGRSKHREEHPPDDTKSPARKTKKARAPQFNVRALLGTFQLKKFKLHLDTDDYVLNSYLFPIFYFLSGKNRELKINYNGELLLQMILENRLYRVLFALLRRRA